MSSVSRPSPERRLTARIASHSLTAATTDAARNVADPAKELRARCRAYCQFALDFPRLYQLMFHADLPLTLLYQPDATPGRRSFNNLLAAVRNCIRQGWRRPMTIRFVLPRSSGQRSTGWCWRASRGRPFPGRQSRCWWTRWLIVSWDSTMACHTPELPGRASCVARSKGSSFSPRGDSETSRGTSAAVYSNSAALDWSPSGRRCARSWSAAMAE